MRRYCLVLGLLFCNQITQAQGVLSGGAWYKLAVTEAGVYDIDARLLGELGLDISVVDPRGVQLYGQNGEPLSQVVADQVPEGLLPVAMYFEGNDNAVWEVDERWLFYAPAAGVRTYDVVTRLYDQRLHLYTDTLYYYFTYGQGSAVVLETTASDFATDQVVRTYDALHHHKEELSNVITSGRAWYGEELFVPSKTSLSFDLPFRPAVGVPVHVRSAVMGACEQRACSVAVTLQGDALLTHRFAARPSSNAGSGTSYGVFGYNDVQRVVHTAASAVDFRLGYTLEGTVGSLARVADFFVQTTLPLRYEGGFFFFRNGSLGELRALGYEVALDGDSPRDLLLWEVTNPLRPMRIPFELQDQRLLFRAMTRPRSEFVLFDSREVRAPQYVGRVPNRRIRDGLVPDMLIITAFDLLPAARRLADFRQKNDGLAVRVLLVDAVYDIFSAGIADPTALRNCVRYFYHLDPDKLRYVLLFGGASYDVKGLRDPLVASVPTYQSRESLNPTSTYSSDDYYGFLQVGQGLWEESPPVEHMLAVGIGRIPARTLAQATVVVDKIIAYSDAPPGDWRQKLYFVADDGDHNLHSRNTEDLVIYLDTTYAQYQTKRLYLDNFEQLRSQGRQSSPSCKRVLEEAIQQGALCVNFNGHGNRSSWTAEGILDAATINTLENSRRLPLFVTATCEFGRHDVPRLSSEGERLLFHPQGGSIALMTASRPVFASANYSLDSAFTRAVLRPLPDGTMPRLGDIMRETKNAALGGNRSFILLGDPSLRLAYPKYRARITHINNREVAQDTLRAFSRVTLQGIIEDASDQFVNYTGQARISAYDKTRAFETLGDESDPFIYEERSSLLFSGISSVQRGRFEVSFVVPRSISYRQGDGRVLIYLNPSDLTQPDGSGVWDDFSIGGSVEPVIQDHEGPVIRAYIGDRSFISGDRVGPSVVLYAEFRDATGIRLSSNGVITPLAARLSGNGEERTYSLVSNYQAALDSYQEGKLRYTFPLLEPGAYTLELEAWDNYDNISHMTLDFIVSSHTPLRIFNVINFPNPLTNQTTFTFEHDKGDNLLTVELYVSDLHGARVDTRVWRVGGNQGRVSNLLWHLPRRTLPSGIYVYTLRVTAVSDQTQGTAQGRFILKY